MRNYKQKEYVRIIGNTRIRGHKEMNEMIGKVCEVKSKYYDDETICVYTKDKKDWFLFNTSDTQKVFINDIKEDGTMEGCVKDGYAIGENDVIESDGKKFTVYDFFMFDDKKWLVRTYREGDEDYTLSFFMDEDFKVTPKYPVTQKETITIGGRKYSKDDVENALKNIKEIK